MKKAILVFLGLILTGSLCYAADKPASPAKTAQPAAAVTAQTATGVIDAITNADKEKKTRASLALKEDNGTVVKFIIARGVSTANLKPGDKATVEYSTNKLGINKAQKISVIK